MDRIEFYKNRTFGERFFASIDFLKQNWNVLFKNILIGALPLAIFGGYFMQYHQQSSLSNIYTGGASLNPLFMILYFVAVISLVIYLNAMTGAVMIKYGEGNLTSGTGWRDLSGTMFSLSGKTFLIGLILWVISLVIVAVIAVIIGIFVSGVTAGNELAFSGIIFIITMFVILGLVFAFCPFLCLAYYPAYFSGASIWESIKIAFGMGFRNWGSVFATILLAGIVLFVIGAIFGIPNIVVTLFSSQGEMSIWTFIFSFLAIFGTVLTYPVMFIFIAFQYFSIVESEQGVSLGIIDKPHD